MASANQVKVDTLMKRMSKKVATMDKQFAALKKNVMAASEVIYGILYTIYKYSIIFCRVRALTEYLFFSSGRLAEASVRTNRIRHGRRAKYRG